jgi:hypothetical protein
MRPAVLIDCAALVLIALACSSTEPDVDPQGCPQTREFGNYGCARASGVVLDQAGDPVAGVHISLRPHEGAALTWELWTPARRGGLLSRYTTSKGMI